MRAAGDRELAAQVKALRRPTVAAWLVNQLVREHRDDVDELLETGASLQQTQSALLAGKADGAQLQALTASRRQQIDGLVAVARQLAVDDGRKSAPLEAVDSTLIAATADEAAAAAVLSGRLVKELSYSGFGMGDYLSDAVGPRLRGLPKGAPKAAAKPGASTTSASKRSAAKAAVREGATPVNAAAAEKRTAAVAAAAAAMQETQRAVHDALGTADDAQRALDAVSREVERAADDEELLVAELAAVRERITDTKERERAARGAARAAHADAERARSALVRAQQKVNHLR